MIQLEQLEQLIAFYEKDTITKAAEHLLISQPSLTRSLQKLEDELQIQLFHRQKNKTTFTDTGLYTVEQAKILLAQVEQFSENIQRQNQLYTQLYIGVCAPGPIYELEDRAKSAKVIKKLHFDVQDEAVLLNGLKQGTYQFIVTEFPVEDEQIDSTIFMKEQLMLAVPSHHLLAKRDKLQLSDLNGLNILLRTNLGSWDQLIESLTQTTFLTQSESTIFNQLITVTDLPYFVTNVTELYFEQNPETIYIPIIDDSTTKTFYLSVLKKYKNLIEGFQ